VKADAAGRFVDWVISEQGQGAIASYKVDDQQLFFPNAARPGQS
jgi:tungstate transport system substrate-binding protein